MLGLGSSIVTQGFVEGAASPPAPLLLNTYSGAAAAYSLRLLDNAYTGSAIRVRREDDSTEQDIGFDSNGDLDISALATFCSGTDGFVKTWYSQTGSNDATQAATTRQPKIYDSATGVVTENGKTALEFDGIDDGLALGSIIAAASQKYTFTTHAVNSAATQWSIFYESTSSDVVPLAASGSGSAIVFGYTLNALYQDGGSAFSGTRNDLYNAYTSAGQSLTTIDFSGDGIGGFFNRTSFAYQGTAQEIVIYDSDQSANRTGIESNINTEYAIYGQSPTGLLADYPGAAAAYSLRQLISTANYAVAVRRDSDDAVLPIGFVNGELDTTTLADFCSGTDGFVSVWFDQSGEGNDATQTTPASQPKIYDSSTGVVTENGKPAIQMDSNTKNLSVPNSKDTFKFLHDGSLSSTNYVVSPTDARETSGTTAKELFETGQYSSSIGLEIIYTSSQYSGTEIARFLVKNGTESVVDYTTPAQSFDVGQNLVTFYIDADNATAADRLKVGLNGETLLTGNTSTAAPSTANSQLDFTIYGGFTAHWQEVVVWNSDQSSNRSAIETNINDFYSIY